jgi:2-polyprenyl-3-methyl-5-hydroxy-6-metoxy-1,4-benzoquinol methylase
MDQVTETSIKSPIAVMSFDRPHYLKAVLISLKAQKVPIAPTAIFLFQDGYRSRNGQDLADPLCIERCIELFETIFPGSKIFTSSENLGVAFNFVRAENYFFEQLGTEAAFFFEDDLVLSPHYLTALRALTAIALEEKRIAYIAAYGDHRASLAEQTLSAKKLILMRHKWGFALTRRQWLAQRDILAPYLEILARADYRLRDHGAIRQYFKKLGFGSNGTSQDAMKDVASCVLGTVKVMSAACFGKYIGEVGLHSNSRLYEIERYSQTSMFPEEIASFDTPSSAILNNWVDIIRTDGVKILRSINSDNVGPAKQITTTKCEPEQNMSSDTTQEFSMIVTRDEIDSVRWFHSINFGNGIISKGVRSLESISLQADTVFKHGITGKSVLDVGAWDGALSFEAERRGASRVVACDSFCWTGAGWGKKRAFDLAKRQLESKVEEVILNISDLGPNTVGTFDVVLFLGVLYHLKDPMGAIENMAQLTRELLVVETETALDTFDKPLMTFFPGRELNNDATNWWAPNIRCVEAMLNVAGFKKVEFTPFPPWNENLDEKRGRFIFHAWK